MTPELTHLWTCDKTIFRIGIPAQKKKKKKKKKRKRASSQQNLEVFSGGIDSENKII